MADPKDIDPNEDPHIFGEVEMEDDGTADIIRKLVDDMNAEDDDDGGFDQPPSDRDSNLPDVVSPDEGHELLDKAKDAKPEKVEVEKPDSEQEQKADTQKTPDDENTEGEDSASDDDGDKAPDYTKSSDADLLDGMDEGRRAEVSRRLTESADIMNVFKNHTAELERHSTTPVQALNRLVELNAFAQQNPGEYLAWVSKETGSDDPTKAIGDAAKLFGYKLVKDEPETNNDDDEFLTDRERDLIKENAELKAAQNRPKEFGPDTPDRQRARDVQQGLNNFINEKDEAGQLKRPHFQMLTPQITQMAQQHTASTGQAVTTNDLQRFYDQAIGQISQMVTPQPNTVQNELSGNPAAQDARAMEKTIKDKAAAAEKAKRASKNIDGTGQGASRRPALADDASIDETIRYFANQKG